MGGHYSGRYMGGRWYVQQHRAGLMSTPWTPALIAHISLCYGAPTEEGTGQLSRQQRPVWEKVSSRSGIH